MEDNNSNYSSDDDDNNLHSIGAVVWDSSVIFIKYIEKNYRLYNYEKLNNKKVLELGSGCGLAGISLMLLGCKVTFTDLSNDH
eukprot:gene17696-23286_t